MGVSKNSGTPKSSILIGFSIIFTIHFGVPPIFGHTHIYIYIHIFTRIHTVIDALPNQRFAASSDSNSVTYRQEFGSCDTVQFHGVSEYQSEVDLQLFVYTHVSYFYWVTI